MAGETEDCRDESLEFRLVNVELPENQHFIQDYRPFTKSLVRRTDSSAWGPPAFARYRREERNAKG